LELFELILAICFCGVLGVGGLFFFNWFIYDMVIECGIFVVFDIIREMYLFPKNVVYKIMKSDNGINKLGKILSSIFVSLFSWFLPIIPTLILLLGQLIFIILLPFILLLQLLFVDKNHRFIYRYKQARELEKQFEEEVPYE